jgi:cell pole-organizing protein PopZ
MEEILASIRRILKEEDIAPRPEPEDEDDDLLVLDSSMIAASNIAAATALPVDTGLLAAHHSGPDTSYHEPLHFTGETAPAEPLPEWVAQAGLSESHISAPEPEVAESPAPAHSTSRSVPAPEPDPEEEFMEDHVQSPDGLVSDAATIAIANTIGTLVRSISTERAVSVSRGGITIEDIVREEIKPVLKAWLDTHLPTLVERIVRAEIGRVIDRTQA